MKKIMAAVLMAVGSIAALAAPAQAATPTVYYAVHGDTCGRDQDPDPDIEVYYSVFTRTDTLDQAERVAARYDNKCQFVRIDTITVVP